MSENIFSTTNGIFDSGGGIFSEFENDTFDISLNNELPSFSQENVEQSNMSFENNIPDNVDTAGGVDTNKLDFEISQMLSQSGAESSSNGKNLSPANSIGKSKQVNRSPRWSMGTARKTQMTFKEQERVIDEIKKENFSLKLKIYFLERRIHEMVVETMEQSRTKCDLQHGMSEIEESEYQRAIAQAERLHQENNALHSKYADLLSEFKRLQETLKRTNANDASNIAEENEKNRVKINQLRTQISVLKSQLATQTSENDDLHSELEAMRSRPISAASSSRGLFSEEFSDQYEEKLGQLRDKVAELKLQLNEKNLEVDEYKEETACLKDDLTLIRTENVDLITEINTLHKLCHDNESLHHMEMENSDRQMNLLHQEVENLRIQMNEINQNLNHEVELRNATEEKEKNYEKDLEKLRNEKKDIEIKTSQKINELDDKLLAAQQQISELCLTIKERDADLQYSKQQLGNQTNRTKESADRYNREQERLRNDLDATRLEAEKLRSKLEAIGDEFESKKSQILKYENEIKHLNNLCTKQNEKLSANEETIHNLQSENRDKNVTVDKLKSQVFELEKNLNWEKSHNHLIVTQYSDQIEERNNLLLATHGSLNTLMPDVTGNSCFTKITSSNFQMFNESLTKILEYISNIRDEFERKSKTISDQWQEQYEYLESQIDAKVRLINKHEITVNKVLSTQKELRESLQTRNVRAEELDIKLKESEEHISTLEFNYNEIKGKLQVAEEVLKVEKQGAKEKTDILIENVKDLESQLQAQNRRNTQLQELISIQKASMDATKESKAITAKAENTFAMLNEQLREQLEEKNKTIDNERQRVKHLEEQFSSLIEEHKRLCITIEKREALLNKALGGLQLISQKKDLVDNSVFLNLREVTEEMQTTLLDGEGRRRPSYQPPPYINPPWKPVGPASAGSNTSITKKIKSISAKTATTNLSNTNTTPSKIRVMNNTKSKDPTKNS
ncbi:846_t:CDS:2 [Diversispora eburnea]|uniref:846_t:CDS:1 n=1 Tax=Diversispora eburnea TaxID=1213867 RepID=A0A9N8VRG6_9GLOM|nr:846_t:CDS:2 [Diversispora eburnea]